MAVKLFDNDSGAELGDVSEEQLQFLIDHLEEETDDDKDYYLRPETLDFLAGKGADDGLMDLLRKGLGDGDGFEIRWQRRE